MKDRYLILNNWSLAVIAVLTFGLLVTMATLSYADSPRRGETKPLVTVVEAPGDYTALPWSAQPVPVDALALASPLRTEIAADIFAGLLSDPSWRVQYDSLFRSFMSWGHDRDVAAVMADAMAAERAVAFADALLRAAGE